ncbi:hypothetical protein GQ53DRAFT_593616, partial [Thozetella sp. PMI_491]
SIVFIHGFTGHPERTWVCKKGTPAHREGGIAGHDTAELTSKVRKLNPFSTPSTPVYWPRDLLPTTVPDARILTYGYDTRVRHWAGPQVSKSTVYDIAWDFLVALERERQSDPLRPVLFVAHSLGGIVTKEMLRRSNGCTLAQSHLHRIFRSTLGIMFFGTPHSGADPRRFFHRVFENMIRAAGYQVNEQIVNTLLPSAERLRELRDEFGPMAQNQHWTIHSFQEQYGFTVLGGRKVVDDTSSYLGIPDIEVHEHIAQDHVHMCQFSGLEDPEYRKVASAFRRFVKKL